MYRQKNISLRVLLLYPVVLSSLPLAAHALALNDTGVGKNKYSAEQTDYYFRPQDVADYPGQDPQFGRDAAQATDVLDKKGDGHAGFDFSEAGDCVLDNVTGLMWEVKTDASDPGLQSNKWTFRWVGENIQVALEKMPKKENIHDEISSDNNNSDSLSEQDITLDSGVLFGYDSAALSDEAKAAIDKYVDGFRNQFNRIANITVIGHTDGIASQKYNQKLSEKRARAVADYLESIDGIPDKDIEAIGKGKLEPVASNDTEDGRAKNRRVVIKLEFISPETDQTEVVDNTDTEKEKSEQNNKKDLMEKIVQRLNHPPQPEKAIPAYCSDKKTHIPCDTQSYIHKMNEQQLCGHSDWRLPTREELRSIADYGLSMPAIDKDYFPNTVSAAYWTSDVYVNNQLRVWVVDFEHGGDNSHEKHRALPIRLVRQAVNNTAHSVTPTDNPVEPNSDEEGITDSISDFFKPVTDLWK